MQKLLSNDNISTEEQKTYSVFKAVLVVQLLMAIGIGYLTDTLLFGLLCGLLIIALPAFLSVKSPHLALSRHAMAIATQLLAALHIQQTQGMTEMHFQVFVLLAFLSFFRDWRVVVSGTVVIAVHHILGFVSQQSGMGLVVFEDSQPAFTILLIHAAFAIVECGVLSVMAHKASGEHKKAVLLDQAVSNIVQTDGSLLLTEANIPKDQETASFNSLLKHVQSLAISASNASSELLNISDKVKVASFELEGTVGEQNKQVGTITDSMQSMTISISDVADLSKNANTVAEAANQSTESTKDAIKSSSSNIEQLKVKLESTSQAITDLSSKCENIASVMQSIKSVAEQTNLLALNAAIESARAGEHGRGFAVVADEVRNLAIKSKESVEEIEHITSMLTESAQHSVSNMNDCVKDVELAVNSSRSATDDMSNVSSSIQQVSNDVTHVADSAGQQAAASQEIMKSTDSLNQLFSNEQQQVNTLKSDVEELSKLADELNGKLSAFKLA